MLNIVLSAGSSYVVVDGISIPIDNGARAEIVDYRMYVPMRSLGTAASVAVY